MFQRQKRTIGTVSCANFMQMKPFEKSKFLTVFHVILVLQGVITSFCNMNNSACFRVYYWVSVSKSYFCHLRNFFKCSQKWSGKCISQNMEKVTIKEAWGGVQCVLPCLNIARADHSWYFIQKRSDIWDWRKLSIACLASGVFSHWLRQFVHGYCHFFNICFEALKNRMNVEQNTEIE